MQINFHYKYFIVVISTLSFLLKDTLQVGKITSDIDLPITNTLSNKAEYADYTFRFVLETRLFQGGYIEVVFPDQFASGIGIPYTATCTPATCTKSERTVQFYESSDLYPGLVYSFIIKNVLNPSVIGGTGMFSIYSKKNSVVIDQNLMFGHIGISDTINTFTSTVAAIDSTSKSNAGEISKVTFSFKTQVDLPQDMYIKIEFPASTFEMTTNPSTSAFPVNGVTVKGNLYSTQENDIVKVYGFSEAQKSGSEIGFGVTVRNPKNAQTTNTFNLFSMKIGTTNAFARKTSVAGVTITAGLISQIKLKALRTDITLSKAKKAWFRLEFKLRNDLPASSYINIKIPGSFTLDTSTHSLLGTPTGYYLESGLEDESSTVELAISHTYVSDYTIKIEKYKAVTSPDIIQVQMLLTVPTSPGLTTPIEISSFNTSGVEIDKDTSEARTTIISVDIPTTYSVAISSPATADGTTIKDLTFTLKSKVGIPVSGWIKLIFGSSMSLGDVSTTNCFVWKSSNSSYLSSSDCYKRDKEVFIKVTEAYPLGIDSNFQLNGVLVSPASAGSYDVEVITYNTDLVTQLESWMQSLVFTSSDLSPFTAKNYPLEENQLAVFWIQFTTLYQIPASIVQTTAQDETSYIYMRVMHDSTNGAVDNCLGMGTYTAGVETSIPCKATYGLIPQTGTNVNCTLTCGDYTATTYPIIKLRNYATVEANKEISIMIPNFQNPADSTNKFQLLTALISVKNRVVTLISSLDLTGGTAIATSATLETVTASTNVASHSITAGTKINSQFYVESTQPNLQSLAVGHMLIYQLKTYDIGFVPDPNQIVVSIAGSYLTTYSFSGIDWIVCINDTGSNIATSASSKVKIENLIWPRYVNEFAVASTNKVLIRFVSDTLLTNTMNPQNMAAWPNSVVTVAGGTFTGHELAIDKKRLSEIDCTYTFSFIPENDMPDGTTVTLTLPTHYNLKASYPPIAITTPNFESESTSLLLTTTYTAKTVTISNIREFQAGIRFYIIISGMRNPSYTGVLDGWEIQSQKNPTTTTDKMIDKLDSVSTNMFPYQLSITYEIGTMSFNSITNFPTNQDEIASYTFAFLLQTKLPVGAEIHIKFPVEYTSLPLSPDCFVSGGITTFSNCYTVGTEIILEMDSVYNTDVIFLTIKGITNPVVTATTSFEGFTFYDATTVDETKSETQSSRTLALDNKANLLSIREFYMDPKNEAEIATYTISFLPVNNIAKGERVLIIFPGTFDKLLGPNVSVYLISGLTGVFTSEIYDGKLIIKDFDAYDVTLGVAIKIQIVGIVNPNKQSVGHSGYIGIGTMDATKNMYKDYLANAAAIETTSAPGWLILNSMALSNVYARDYAHYVFNVTASQEVETTANSGAVIVDLPVDFEERPSVLECYPLANMGSEITCIQAQRKIQISGHTSKLNGELAFNVTSIENPLDALNSKMQYIKTYDGVERNILQRTFGNLDITNTTFSYKGPVLSVNNDDPIYVEKGTQTVDLYIKSSEIMALNQTLVPTNSDIEFVPTQIQANIGLNMFKFRTSVPQATSAGNYTVTWQTKGDLADPMYTPLKKTIIIITENGDVPITIAETPDIPFKGTSQPIVFAVSYAPNLGFEVLVSFKDSYTDVIFDKNTVTFDAGTNQASFEVYFQSTTTQNQNDAAQSIEIIMELIGINKDIYKLPYTSLQFNVGNSDNTPPEVTDQQQLEKNQTAASIYFTTSDICTAYYVLTLKGTLTPDLAEMQTQTALYASTRKQYGKYQVGKEREVYLTFDGLEAEIDYVVYIFLYDRGQNEIEAAQYLEFKTDDRYEVAFIDLKFLKTYINVVEREKISNTVAYQLSLNNFKVEELKYAFTFLPTTSTVSSSRLRTLQTTSEQITYLTLSIIPDPYSSVYESPLTIASYMNNSTVREKMYAAYPTYDKDFTIPTTEWQKYEAKFASDPAIYSELTTSSGTSFSVRLDNFGWIYSVCVKGTEDLGKPSPYQIQQGTDVNNIPRPGSYIEIKESYTVYNVSVNYLDADTSYNMYVTTGSAQPGYPDLLNTNSTVLITFKTASKAIPEVLSLNKSSLNKFSMIIVCFFCAIIMQFITK